jgi:hypothetical protein
VRQERGDERNIDLDCRLITTLAIPVLLGCVRGSWSRPPSQGQVRASEAQSPPKQGLRQHRLSLTSPNAELDQSTEGLAASDLVCRAVSDDLCNEF